MALAVGNGGGVKPSARYCYREVLPFAVMVMVECANVGNSTLFKAASHTGMSYMVFVVYSFAVSALSLVPLAFLFHRFFFFLFLGFLFFLCIFTTTYQIKSMRLMILLQEIATSSINLFSSGSDLPPRFYWVFHTLFF